MAANVLVFFFILGDIPDPAEEVDGFFHVNELCVSFQNCH